MDERIKRMLDESEKQKAATRNDLSNAVNECVELIKSAFQTPPRREFIRYVIKNLFDAQNGRCAICGGELTTYEVDHIIPISKGGGNERGNLQLTHSECNNKKRAKIDPQMLLQYLEDMYLNRVQ